jgi:hypothetical protein
LSLAGHVGLVMDWEEVEVIVIPPLCHSRSHRYRDPVVDPFTAAANLVRYVNPLAGSVKGNDPTTGAVRATPFSVVSYPPRTGIPSTRHSDLCLPTTEVPAVILTKCCMGCAPPISPSIPVIAN